MASLSNQSSTQNLWKYNATACARPPSDYGVPILCSTSNSNGSASYFGLGADYELFAPCCSPSKGARNIYTTEMSCGQVYCFTNDTKLANSWSSCINNYFVFKLQEMKSNSSNITMPSDHGIQAMCESIDYDALKKGVVTSGAKREHGGWHRIGCTLLTIAIVLTVMF